MDELLKVLVYPHNHLHGAERTSGHNTDSFYIANGHTLQVHRLSRAYALSIVKVCNESDLAGKKTTRPADEEDKQGQSH